MGAYSDGKGPVFRRVSSVGQAIQDRARQGEIRREHDGGFGGFGGNGYSKLRAGQGEGE